MTRYKFILTFLFLHFIVFSFAQKEQIKWLDFEQAIALQKTTPKKIFIDVCTDWCTWCVVMDRRTYVNEKIIQELNQNYYSVKLNAESTKEFFFQSKKFINKGATSNNMNELAIALLQGQMAFPAIVFIDEKSDLISSISGYQSPKNMKFILNYISSNSYKKMPYANFLKINN